MNFALRIQQDEYLEVLLPELCVIHLRHATNTNDRVKIKKIYG